MVHNDFSQLLLLIISDQLMELSALNSLKTLDQPCELVLIILQSQSGHDDICGVLNLEVELACGNLDLGGHIR